MAYKLLIKKCKGTTTNIFNAWVLNKNGIYYVGSNRSYKNLLKSIGEVKDVIENYDNADFSLDKIKKDHRMLSLVDYYLPKPEQFAYFK